MPKSLRTVVLQRRGKRSSTSVPRYITANPTTYESIKEVRDLMKQNPTRAEDTLWQELRNKKQKYKFRRQHIVDNFVVDFVCIYLRLIVEVDGEIHDDQREYDKSRTRRLNELGYQVIRFSNNEVLCNIQPVLKKIEQSMKH